MFRLIQSSTPPIEVYSGPTRPIYVDGVWECVGSRYTDPAGTVYAVQEVPEPEAPQRPVLTITSISSTDEAGTIVRGDLRRVSCPVGTTLTITAELRVGNQVLPMTSVFQMPVKSRDGRERLLSAPMTNGVSTVVAPFAESGVWQVTEAEINSDLPAQMHMSFEGIEIFVVLA